MREHNETGRGLPSLLCKCELLSVCVFFRPFLGTNDLAYQETRENVLKMRLLI